MWDLKSQFLRFLAKQLLIFIIIIYKKKKKNEKIKKIHIPRNMFSMAVLKEEERGEADA